MQESVGACLTAAAPFHYFDDGVNCCINRGDDSTKSLGDFDKSSHVVNNRKRLQLRSVILAVNAGAGLKHTERRKSRI